MKFLVLTTDYPKQNENVTLMYIHTRNKYYLQNNIEITVLNFKTQTNYIIDGVNVISLREYEKNMNHYDILISHAPNIRNHYKFLKQHGKCFKDIIFFFHGHEVLKISDVYPKPYNYLKTSSKISLIKRDVYDNIKLKLWKKYFIKILNKSHFIFVSQWMYDMFIKYVEIPSKTLEPRRHIIYNSVGKDFEMYNFDVKANKEYDFITIRNNLDGSKYSIDIVTKIAKNNPKYRFCVIGKGDFYKHNEKPNNLIWINKNLEHNEIINILNKSKCALLPSKTDAQGVMACEMATFGIPLITSNIDVFKEVFNTFEHVEFIDNDADYIDIEPYFKKAIANENKKKLEKYFAKNTLGEEVNLLTKIYVKKINPHESKIKKI